ncbi:MAG: heat-inducible transcription repressor HrcA [Oscillospiraceae bacterium]|nr:heat-inducible transcription repressor HrcA [Oscillospiraceae bacterium]
MEELSQRKKQILQAIIEDYIATAEPVASRNLAKNHDMGLSAATIRNEMADLEDMGYLDKPHTSAGRVPSEMGYRFYVDSLMRKYSLTIEEMAGLQQSMDRSYSKLEGVISEISNIVSKVTRYPTVVAFPHEEQRRVRSVKLLLIEEKVALVVVITDGGVVRNRKIKFSEAVDYQTIDSISDFLSKQLAGLSVSDMTPARLMLIYEAMGSYADIMKVVVGFVLECLKEEDERLYIGGTSNILDNPEFADIERAREFFSFMDHRENVSRMLSRLEDTERGISIRIGSESGVEEMKDTSIVVANYSVGNKLRGKIGIIGPTRMDYARVVSSLELINTRLSEILDRMLGENQ